jgi:hypothetical protein
VSPHVAEQNAAVVSQGSAHGVIVNIAVTSKFSLLGIWSLDFDLMFLETARRFGQEWHWLLVIKFLQVREVASTGRGEVSRDPSFWQDVACKSSLSEVPSNTPRSNVVFPPYRDIYKRKRGL